MNPLNNHRQSLVLGIILALVLAGLLGGWQPYLPGFARWFHIVAGVFWIGLLYYFNVAQTPALADAAADKGGPGGAGITKYVAPRALFWFRWGAVATWLGGRLAAGSESRQCLHCSAPGFVTIGIGAWLGTIMLLNVWGIIWPNQKKILGIKPATDEEKAKARKAAGMASRVNFVLSIPMLMCMASQSHGLPLRQVSARATTAISARRSRRRSPRTSAAGDVTAALVPAAQQVRGRVITREPAVLCGGAWVDETFRRSMPRCSSTWHAADGEPLGAGQVIFEIAGPARAILTGERTALNFLQLLVGTATTTRALRRGGGRHRLPHPRYAQDPAGAAHRAEVRRALRRRATTIAWDCTTWCSSRRTTSSPPARSPRRSPAARRSAPAIPVEVEVESLRRTRARRSPPHPDIIMLDEFTLEDMRAAVALNRARGAPVKLEASGSVSLETVRAIAATGVDYISIGRSPSTCSAVDLSMRLEFGARLSAALANQRHRHLACDVGVLGARAGVGVIQRREEGGIPLAQTLQPVLARHLE